MITCSKWKEKLLVIPVVTSLSRKLYGLESKPISSRRSTLSTVKAEKAIKRITRSSVFLLWSEAEAVMSDSLAALLDKNSRIKRSVNGYSPKVSFQ
jgi:hypothetical protein